MKRYNPKEIEPKWQKAWEANGTYNVKLDSSKPKFVGFGMFNYPSGAGIHVGHVRNFTIPDVVTRFKRQQGYESYQPVGWDSFGLPAENFAIKTGVSPQESTKSAIKKYHDQYRAMGWAVDWTKEINTTDPEYYKWTQWVFTKLFEHDLAYKQESPQWWCDHDKTVLADEQVESGKCWRCGNPVTKKNLNQWFFKITDYADELLEATDDLDWTQSVKSSQKAWIGRSVGAEVDFKVEGSREKIKVFTTRVDTLFGVTFIVLAPEHPLVSSITTPEQKSAVEEYIAKTSQKTEVQRQQEADREKTGVFTGGYAINPINNEKIPIWIADYVLMGYGTGAIMAVPAHDQRDYEFAQKFELPVRNVIDPVAIREDAKKITEFKKKRKIVALVENQKGEILTINWGPTFGGRLTIGGTVEGQEKPETTALREVAEETGYTDLEVVEVGEETFHYKYYAFSKQEGHEVTVNFVHLRLKSEARQEPNLDDSEKDKFNVEWASRKIVEQEIVEPLHRYALNKFIFGQVYSEEGLLSNSGKYDGLSTSEAREKITADLTKSKQGKEKVNYKMRDWLISRQRYWGAPIPVIHCPKDGPVAVPEKDLPVVLPEVKDYQPTGGNTSVLAGVKDWVNTTCPKCGGPGQRETDTMDGYVCSSWYFLRYLDPHNAEKAWDPEQANHWLPIDFYNGGDHATAHLLYARFFMRFFHKLGLVDRPEPFKKMVFNGKIKASDGSAFSKSKGNGIDPLEVIEQGYGADAIRLYEMFAAPVELDVLWDEQGIPGAYRFINRVWALTQEFLAAKDGKSGSPAALSATHKTIKKVTEDLEASRFNTAIAALMELTNTLYKAKETDGLSRSADWQFAVESLIQMVAPFAPHAAEELWQQLGHKDSVHVDHWPKFDPKYLVSDEMTIVVQVNGKVRANVSVPADSGEEAVVEAAQADENVAKHLAGQEPKKTIYVAGKLVNFVV